MVPYPRVLQYAKLLLVFPVTKRFIKHTHMTKHKVLLFSPNSVHPGPVASITAGLSRAGAPSLDRMGCFVQMWLSDYKCRSVPPLPSLVITAGINHILRSSPSLEIINHQKNKDKLIHFFPRGPRQPPILVYYAIV